MSLPKSNYSQHDIYIPSLGKKYKFRPFLVKEEKILLMYKEGESNNEILKAMLQIVNNCSLNYENVEKLPPFDILWIYLQLRKISVGGVIEQRYRNQEDFIYNIKIIIDDIKISPILKNKLNLTVGEDRVLKMRFPSTEDVIEIEAAALSKEEKEDRYLLACVESYFEKDSIYNFKDEPEDEVIEFLNNLPEGTYQKISAFFANIPTLSYVAEYIDEDGKKQSLSFATIDDFFI
jgi:hypothetical protein